MWDEKQFFEDFVKESDKIKPDRNFVEKLATLAEEESSKKITPFGRNYKILASAAVVLLLVSVTGVYFLSNNGNSTAVVEESRLQAGNAEETGGDDMISGGQFESNEKDSEENSGLSMYEDCISLSEFEAKGYQIVCNSDEEKASYSVSITNNTGADKTVRVVAVFKMGDEIADTDEVFIDIADGAEETVMLQTENKDFDTVEYVFAEYENGNS